MARLFTLFPLQDRASVDFIVKVIMARIEVLRFPGKLGGCGKIGKRARIGMLSLTSIAKAVRMK